MERYQRMNLRLVVSAAAALFLATGCAAEPENAGPSDRHDFGNPGYVKAITADVAFYPACGNETLTVDGTTWYQYDPANIDEFPDPQLNIEAWLSGGFGNSEDDAVVDTDADAAAGIAGTLPRGGAGGVLATMRGVATVAPPESGDDVGIFVEYSGDIAYWQSQSQKLATWLTTTEITYTWVC